ncbi:capsular biosynthesis protein [Bacillus sp. ISL-75]|uniref:YveK family protein n=1 Tax=Bacillus sp. ISL-75 TaxID=2819137 RepID=UPI001BEAD67B|nr:Wzz/FepE/Etk N-terminal domain-containing protein [Bacillus sp. ISL-75]MBT2729637.1 capsular biosynthesis protein [Bacillus sp. ISL-75]
MEENIGLKELLGTITKRLELILSVAFIAMIISGIISYFVINPTYQASTQILVNQSRNEQTLYNYNEVQTNLQLINTYNVIIKSPAILNKVVDELNLDITTAELIGKITVMNEKNSQVVTISVQDKDPKVAALIANEAVNVFKSEIIKIMNVDNISILAKANFEKIPSPIKPKPLLNIAIACVVGLIAGVGCAFLIEYFNTTFKNEQDIERILGLPLIGVIALMDYHSIVEKKTRVELRKSKRRGETFGV